MKKNILISGYYGFDNIGDDAMIETFSNYFRENRDEVTVMSKNPEKTSKQFNIKAINRSNIFEIVLAIKKTDVLISGGGTLLQDVTKVISIWYYLFIILLGLIFRKKVYILFQGMGPINNKFNIWLTKQILKKVKVIVLRDQKAYEEMQKLGFDTSNVKVAADLVFALSNVDKKENVDLIKRFIVDYSNKKKYVGVSLRPWNNCVNEIDLAKLLDKIAINNDVEIVFFPFHAKQDYMFTTNIISKMMTKCHLIYAEFIPSQMIRLMSLMNCNIGVRLHSLIFSIIAKVPIVGITYDPKIDGFLKEMNMKPVCEYEKLDEEKILIEVEKILKGEFDASVFEKVDSNKEIVVNELNKIMKGI